MNRLGIIGGEREGGRGEGAWSAGSAIEQPRRRTLKKSPANDRARVEASYTLRPIQLAMIALRSTATTIPTASLRITYSNTPDIALIAVDQQRQSTVRFCSQCFAIESAVSHSNAKLVDTKCEFFLRRGNARGKQRARQRMLRGRGVAASAVPRPLEPRASIDRGAVTATKLKHETRREERGGRRGQRSQTPGRSRHRRRPTREATADCAAALHGCRASAFPLFQRRRRFSIAQPGDDPQRCPAPTR